MILYLLITVNVVTGKVRKRVKEWKLKIGCFQLEVSINTDLGNNKEESQI